MFVFDPQSGKLIRTNRGDFISGGLSGGQTATGDTASGGNLTLMSTAHATKGKILFGTSAYDEVNNRLGIGTTGPLYKLHVVGGGITIDNAQAFGMLDNVGGLTGQFYMTSANNFQILNTSTSGSILINTKNNSGAIQFFTGATTTERLRIASGGNVGIGLTGPTAYLHIKAGTATASTAPLKFTSGTLNTTAEAGAVEFNTDDLKFTITTGAARKGIVLNDGANLTATKVPVASTNGRLIDSSFYSDGTDNWWAGAGSGLPYGSMYIYTLGAGSTTITVSAADTWYEIATGVTGGSTNNMTFQNNHEIKVLTAGVYKIDWSLAIGTSSNNEIEGTIMKNGTADTSFAGMNESMTANKSIPLTGTGILTLAANDVISLAVLNHTGANNITIDHLNFSMVMIGG